MMNNAPGINQPQSTTTCPNCRATIPATAKFCSECGTNMKPVCPTCKKECTAGSKFCQECGTKL